MKKKSPADDFGAFIPRDILPRHEFGPRGIPFIRVRFSDRHRSVHSRLGPPPCRAKSEGLATLRYGTVRTALASPRRHRASRTRPYPHVGLFLHPHPPRLCEMRRAGSRKHATCSLAENEAAAACTPMRRGLAASRASGSVAPVEPVDAPDRERCPHIPRHPSIYTPAWNGTPGENRWFTVHSFCLAGIRGSCGTSPAPLPFKVEPIPGIRRLKPSQAHGTVQYEPYCAQAPTHSRRPDSHGSAPRGSACKPRSADRGAIPRV